MKITSGMSAGRRTWELDNGALQVTLMAGGGHIAGLHLHALPGLNPLWQPVWKTIDPWRYRAGDSRRYESKLLAAIAGHNLCLGAFGGPSPDEARAGLGGHGEAPVVRWRVLRRRVSRAGLQVPLGCVLPIAQMAVRRTVTMRRGSTVVQVREEVTSLARRDLPFTMCEHVTFGPPFIEKGCTVFDMPATQGHTFPGPFGKPQRLRTDTAFRWPQGPGARGGTVNLRTLDGNVRRSSDFSTQLINPTRAVAWFSALNPRRGLLVAYVWRREDFPWVGNWEENYARLAKPWDGRSLTRGMEFANTPFPVSLRAAVSMGRFQGLPTYRWLPARGRCSLRYSILVQQVPLGCRGVADIRPQGRGFALDLVV